MHFFVEMALAAEMSHLGAKAKGAELHGVSFLEPFDLEVGTALVCEVSSEDGITFRSAADESRVACTVGDAGAASPAVPGGESLAVLKQRCTEEVTGIAERYADLALREFHGPQFQTLSQVWKNSEKNELLASLRVPEDNERYHLHPALLDGVFQLAGFVDESSSSGSEMKAFVPACQALQLPKF